MSSLYLIADDLTGALDSAVSFCGILGPIPVFLGTPHPSENSHVAVDLATRDADIAFAVKASSSVARSLAATDIAFKKIDSLLRGHWAIELAELFKRGAFSTCVFAPAFPSQGRVTEKGRQIVRADDGSSFMVGVDPVKALSDLGLRVISISSTDSADNLTLVSGDIDVVVFDAATDEDLRVVVRWGLEQKKPVLWCGAAGLARAVAQHEPPLITAIPKPVLIIIGTNNPVSKAQIILLAARGSTRHVVVGSNAVEAAVQITDAFQRTGECLLTFEFSSDTCANEAAVAIDQMLGLLLPSIPRPSALVVAGGETLLSVCRAVGATHLEVDAEFSPGIPHSRLRSGCWDGVDVVSKSGAFGNPQLLTTLVGADPLLTHVPGLG